jgi:Ran GTPase-activating protein (RanGAP) involved in mRNA processing and transport
MNKDVYNIFEAYNNVKKSLVNELAPVELSGDYGGSGEEITANFPEMSRGKYDLTPEETKQVYNIFIKKFREDGGNSPKLYKDFYESELAPVIRTVKPSINNTNSKYTSRVLYNALKDAKVLNDERDGVNLSARPSIKGIEKLTKYTFKNAEKLGDEAEPSSEGELGIIDDITIKRFYEKILGEGEYSRKELVKMYLEDNPDVDESDAVIKISDLIMTGFLKKTNTGNYLAVDPDEVEDKDSQEEGEGSGEITPGVDEEDLEEFENDPWGGVYVGPRRGEGSFD